MSSTETQKLNESLGHEFLVACEKCIGATYHRVLTSVDKTGHNNIGGFSFDWSAEYQIIQCQGCKTISFRQASSNSEDYTQVGNDEWEYAVQERIYIETIRALAANCPVLAGVGLRALVETVCEEKDAAGPD